jgi:pimeloyl-ACP methyl ester carboxylesterase
LSGPSFLEARGVSLEVRSVGQSPPGSPIIVLLHEGLGSVSQWKDFPERLCHRTGLGVFAYSRRGYGASAPVPAEARPVSFMHDEAIALPELLDAARLGPVVLVGHSDGASIALLYAAADGGERVRSVVTLAPHLFVEDVTVTNIAAIAEAWHKTDLRARLARHHGANVDGAFLGWSKVWLSPDFRSWNIEEEVARVSVPVLVIQGEDDEYGTLAQVEALRRRAAGAVETLVLTKCGHAPHREKSEATLEAIAAFLEKGRVS